MRRAASLRQLFLTGLVLSLAGANALEAQKKGGPGTEPQHWPCQITLRDAVDALGNPVDGILSDGRGTYVNGEDGGLVRCNVVQAPNSGHDGWLEVFIEGTSVRHMRFPAQQAQTAYRKAGYSAFENRGSFEVKFIRDANLVGQTYLRPFRAYVNDRQFSKQARLTGDSFAPDPIDRWSADFRGTSSVFVVPIDDCTWQVTSNPTYPITEGERANFPRVLRLTEAEKNGAPYASADFVMSFSATVRIIGVKPGCGL